MTNIKYKKMSDKQKYEYIQSLENKLNNVLTDIEDQINFAKSIRGSDGFLIGIRKIINKNKIA